MNNFYIIPLAIEWPSLIGGAGFASLVGLVLFLLKWKRFKPNDVALVNMKNAETEKVKAEAAEIKAKADVTIVDSAFKLIQRLSDECDMTKKQLDKTQHDLDSAQASLKDALNKISEMQTELTTEREKNRQMSEKLVIFVEELNKLKGI